MGMREAEEHYPEPADLVGPYLESIHQREPNVFYDNMAQCLPEEGDLEDPYYDPKLKRIINYDIHCTLCEAAVDHMSDSIRAAAQKGDISQYLQTHEVLSGEAIDSESVVISLVPKVVSFGTYEDAGMKMDIADIANAKGIHQDQVTREMIKEHGDGLKLKAYLRENLENRMMQKNELDRDTVSALLDESLERMAAEEEMIRLNPELITVSNGDVVNFGKDGRVSGIARSIPTAPSKRISGSSPGAYMNGKRM